MSEQHTFDYLTGTVRVLAACHPDLAADLLPFYVHPNDDRWGEHLCRVLYHESIHFWLFISSAYLANIVAGEWLRLETFRDTGRVTSASKCYVR